MRDLETDVSFVLHTPCQRVSPTLGGRNPALALRRACAGS